MRVLFRLWLVASLLWALIAYFLISHPGPADRPLPLPDLAMVILVPSLLVLAIGSGVAWAFKGR